MRLKLHTFDLKLKHKFQIARSAHDIQRTLIVELSEERVTGFGEATSNKYYGITIEKMVRDLQKVKDIIESYSFGSPEEFWNTIYPYLSHNHFALCALDNAMNDLYGKSRGLPLHALWGFPLENMPLTDYTIGIAEVDKMVEKLKEKPWPIYKIKLGTQDDVAIVKELRKHTKAVFRVDANGAWEVGEAIKNSFQLKDLGVEFIEQPLKANDWKGMKKLFEESALPCVADESCQVEADVEKCHNHFHGINIKLTKCGGLTPARRMILKGRSLGMKIMVGCMTESTIGISAIAQLLPQLDYVDMDGALLLEKDIAEGVTIVEGKVLFPEGNGTGARLIV